MLKIRPKLHCALAQSTVAEKIVNIPPKLLHKSICPIVQAHNFAAARLWKKAVVDLKVHLYKIIFQI